MEEEAKVPTVTKQFNIGKLQGHLVMLGTISPPIIDLICSPGTTIWFFFFLFFQNQPCHSDKSALFEQIYDPIFQLIL